jgi:transcriptional regulator with XRE-family HTH domain
MKEGLQLRKQRKSLGLILEVLEAISGVNAGEISRYENGLRKPNEVVRVRIEDALDAVRRVKEAHAGVSINLKDVKFLRTEIKKLQVAASN